MAKILTADDVLLHLNENKADIQIMVANEERDFIVLALDNIIKKLDNDGSKAYDDEAMMRLADFLIMLPDELSFSALTDLATMNDICERCILRRDDLFEILKRVRRKDFENISG